MSEKIRYQYTGDPHTLIHRGWVFWGFDMQDNSATFSDPTESPFRTYRVPLMSWLVRNDDDTPRWTVVSAEEMTWQDNE